MKSRLTWLAPLAAAVGLLATAGSAGAATIWTPLTSGTAQTITSISAPSASEVVYATSGGGIYYLSAPGTFTAATFTGTPPALGLTSVAMSSDGTVGVAVGQGGEIYRSTNSGQKWTAVTGAMEYPASFDGSCSGGWGTLSALKDTLDQVQFVPGSNSVIYITGADDDVLKSTNGGASFTEVNKLAAKSSGSYCVADAGSFAGNTAEFTGMEWTSASVGYFASNSFGQLWRSTDGFTTATQVNDDTLNDYGDPTGLAIDLANPSDLWTMEGGGFTDGVAYSTNGGTNFSTPTYVPDQQKAILRSIAAVGTNVVTAGDSGEIWTSPDGVNFYEQLAPAPLTTTAWSSVAMVPGTNTAYVGGANGALITSATANQVPDTTAPTGTISGPTALLTSAYGTYTIAATDNAGGSGVDTSSYSWTSGNGQTATGASVKFAYATAGTYTITCDFKDLAGNTASATFKVVVVAPTTTTTTPTPTPTPQPPSGTGTVNTTTGGATVGIDKTVTVTGRSARYIPVSLKTKKPRRFVISLLTAPKKGKKQKQLSTLTFKLTTGKATVHLPVPKSVGPGTYEIQVKIFTTGKHGKQVGKSVKQVFILK